MKRYWCPGAGSNHRHRDFQSRALPTELPGHSRSGRASPSKRAALPNRRSLRCPPFRDRLAGRRCDSLRRAISGGLGPCSRGCRTARAPALRACRTAGRLCVGQTGFGIPARHGKRRVGAQARRRRRSAARARSASRDLSSSTAMIAGWATSRFGPAPSKAARRSSARASNARAVLRQLDQRRAACAAERSGRSRSR